MSFATFTTVRTTNVVRAPRFGVSQVGKWLVLAITALVCVMWITPAAFAESGTGLMTENITDTQNLLGSNASAVTDKVKETYDKTGVTVRLIYVDTFGEGAKPSQWSEEALEATDPKPNTVLLAVASGDGSLVVSVSKNSEEWLRNDAAVSQLSKAAMDSLTDSSKQDWSGSAISMMDEIETIKQTSTNSRTVFFGVVGLGAGLAVLIIVIVVSIVVKRRRKAREGAADSQQEATGRSRDRSGEQTSKDEADDADRSAPAWASAAVRHDPAQADGTPGTWESDDAKNRGSVDDVPTTAPDGRPLTRRELREARKKRRGPFGRSR